MLSCKDLSSPRCLKVSRCKMCCQIVITVGDKDFNAGLLVHRLSKCIRNVNVCVQCSLCPRMHTSAQDFIRKIEMQKSSSYARNSSAWRSIRALYDCELGSIQTSRLPASRSIPLYRLRKRPTVRLHLGEVPCKTHNVNFRKSSVQYIRR